MHFQHFFWDFDGTLFDTYPRVDRAMQKALADVGANVSITALQPATKVTLRHAAQLFAPRAVTPEMVMARYRAHAEEEGYDTMLPYPYVEQFLKRSHALGAKHYLYTHRDVSALNALEYYDLAQYFSDAVTMEQGFAHKPAPDALNHLCQKHALQKAQCVMLGDRDIDLDAAKNAGMACALFDPDGYYPSYQADYRDVTFEGLYRQLLGD